MDIILRKAVQGDGKAIVECMNESCENDCSNCFNKYVCNSNFFLTANPELIERKIAQKIGVTILAIDKNKVVGLSMYVINKFSKTQHRAECGWFVRQSYVNKGIATKLVNELMKEAKKNHLKRLEAESSVNNAASLRVAEKLGFKIEGRKTKALLLDDNKLEDTFILGKLL